MSRAILAVTINMVASFTASSNAQTLRLDPIVTIATGEAEHPLYEPHVAINPQNAGHLLVVAIVHGGASVPFAERIKAQKCAAFHSLDGGATWTRHDFAVTHCFDPWVVFLPDGRAVVTILGAHTAFPQLGQVGLFAYRSADVGYTWQDVVGVGRDHDHTTMVVDTNPGRRRGWIYVSSNHSFRVGEGAVRRAFQMLRSRNGGQSFDDAVPIAPNNLQQLAEMPVVLSDGTLVQSFVDGAFAIDSGKTDRQSVLFDRRRAWVIKSTDGGYTFSTPMFVTDACGPPPGYRLSAFAADLTRGPYAGRLYFACRERGGSNTILLTYSRDGGESWTPARPVHDPQLLNNRVPALAVNNRGVVLAGWIDVTGNAPTCQQRVHVAPSLDGGETFAPAQTIATSPHCSTAGDYFGLVGAPDGKFRIVWSEMGARGLQTTTIEVVSP